MKTKILSAIMNKKIVAALLSLAMIGPAANFSVFAENGEYGDLKYKISDGEVTITGCRKSATTVDIPAEIDGCPVTSIGGYAFQYCGAFTSVIIPDSVTRIGEWAFYDCSDLTSVTIGSGVTSISYNAFKSCISLTSVTIGSGVTIIGDGAFLDCPSLISIDADAANSEYASVDGVLFNKAMTTLICCPGGMKGEYTIPDSVTSIGKRAFEKCSGLTTVTIPDSVTSIGKRAFEKCSGLTTVTIPDSVTSIDDSAFQECSGLTSVIIGSGVTSIDDSAFYRCSGLTTVQYAGSEADWNKIKIGGFNEALLNASIIFNGQSSAVTPADDIIKIYVNGALMRPDADPVIVNDRTLLPIRVIAEALGYTVSWDASNQCVSMSRSGIDIQVVIGAAAITTYNNGQPQTDYMDVAAEIRNSRTFIPLRAVAEHMGCRVDWDGNTRSVYITGGEG